MQLVINVGDELTLVKGEKCYKGTLQVEGEETKRSFVKLHNTEPGEPDEITIHLKA